MKFFAISFLVFCCLSLAAAQTPDAKVDETIKLSADVVKLFDADKFAEALPLAREIVAKREKIYGSNHIMLGQSLRNLAYIELKLERRREALANFERALNIYELNEPLSKSDQASQAEMFETVAFVNITNGDPARSVSKLQQAIAIRERLNGPASVDIAGPLRSLGQVYSGQGEFEKALPLLLRSLEIRQKMSIEDANDNLILRETTACALIKVGRGSEAEQINSRFRTIPKNSTEIPKDNTISGGLLNGKATTLPDPQMPRLPKSERESGSVAVRVLINESGRVISACSLSGPRVFHAAAESAAFEAIFPPMMANAKAVKVSGTINYSFAL